MELATQISPLPPDRPYLPSWPGVTVKTRAEKTLTRFSKNDLASRRQIYVKIEVQGVAKIAVGSDQFRMFRIAVGIPTVLDQIREFGTVFHQRGTSKNMTLSIY